MGCCQSTLADDQKALRQQGPPAAKDICYPEKRAAGGLEVLTSCAVAPSKGNTTSSDGGVYTRLVVGHDWVMAALFEAARVSGSAEASLHGPFCDAAAQYCVEHCHTEFKAAASTSFGSATPDSRAISEVDVQAVLLTTLQSLDRRFLCDSNVPLRDRLGSGCTGVLLYLSLPAAASSSVPSVPASSASPGGSPSTPLSASAPAVTASVACVGPCGALLCRTVGGLASATSDHVVMAGGCAASHLAIQDFLRSLAAEAEAAMQQQAGMGRTASRRGSKADRGAKSGKRGKQVAAGQQQQEPPQEPRYSYDPEAPQALGFGAAKGLGAPPGGANGGGGGSEDVQLPEPRVGLHVQTFAQTLRPTDECVVLLSGSAAAALSPADAALLVHRLGKLSAVPFEGKPPPLTEFGQAGSVQLDSLGVVGPPPQHPANASLAPLAAATAASVVPRFNAARLLAAHAGANLAARRPVQRDAPGMPPPCIMTLGLKWPSSSASAPTDATSVMAAAGASTAAVAAAAAAAVRERRGAQYRWQMLRMYYKFPHRHHVAIIEKWHDVFDGVLAAANRKARAVEIAAWRHRQVAVQVSPGGNVKSLKAMGAHQQSPVQQQQTSARSPQQSPPRQQPSQQSLLQSPPQLSKQSLLPSPPRQQHSQQALLQTPPRPPQHASRPSSRSGLPASPATVVTSPPRPAASASAVFASAVSASPPRPAASASAVFASTIGAQAQRAAAVAAATAFASPAAAAAASVAATPATLVVPAGSDGQISVVRAKGAANVGKAADASLTDGRGCEGGELHVPELPSLFELSFRSSAAEGAANAAAGAAQEAGDMVEDLAVSAVAPGVGTPEPGAVAAPAKEEAHWRKPVGQPPGGDARGQALPLQEEALQACGQSAPPPAAGDGNSSCRTSVTGSEKGAACTAAASMEKKEEKEAGPPARQSSSGSGPARPSPSPIPTRPSAAVASQSPTVSNSGSGSGGGMGQSRPAAHTVRSSIPPLQLQRVQGAATAVTPGPAAVTPMRATGIPAAASPTPAAAPAAAAPGPTAQSASQSASAASAPAAAPSGVPRFTPRSSIPTRIPNPSTPGSASSGLPLPPAVTPSSRNRISASGIPGASPSASAGGGGGGSLRGIGMAGASPSARVSANGGGSLGGGIPASSPAVSAGGAAGGSAPRSSISKLPRPGLTSNRPATAAAVGTTPTPVATGSAAQGPLQPTVRASGATTSEPVARSLFANNDSAGSCVTSAGTAGAAAAPGNTYDNAPAMAATDAAVRPPRLQLDAQSAVGATRTAGPEASAAVVVGQGTKPALLVEAPSAAEAAPDEDELLSPDAAQLAAWALEAMTAIASSPSASAGKLAQGQQEAAPRMPLSPRNSGDVNRPAYGPSGRGFASVTQPVKASSGRATADGTAALSRGSSSRFRG